MDDPLCGVCAPAGGPTIKPLTSKLSCCPGPVRPVRPASLFCSKTSTSDRRTGPDLFSFTPLSGHDVCREIRQHFGLQQACALFLSCDHTSSIHWLYCTALYRSVLSSALSPPTPSPTVPYFWWLACVIRRAFVPQPGAICCLASSCRHGGHQRLAQGLPKGLEWNQRPRLSHQRACYLSPEKINTKATPRTFLLDI